MTDTDDASLARPTENNPALAEALSA